MELGLLRSVLRLRRQLAQRDTWTTTQLATHQERSLRALREHCYTASPFYQQFHRGLTAAPLCDLPVLTKAMLMDHYDDVLTDRQIRLAQVQSHQAAMRGSERLMGRYYVAATSGTTGLPGIFIWDRDEWAAILASYDRPYAWGGASFRLTRRSKMAVVSSTTPWHQSALVAATVSSPFIPTLRLDSGDPLDRIGRRLEDFQPDVLVGYASMLGLLASEQDAQRLHIRPKAIFSASEVLTDDGRRRIQHAWDRHPFNVYAATETAGFAAECEQHAGMHLFEDLVISEIVDDDYQQVPAGQYGTKVLVTVLGSRTLPLIRYEMSDSVQLSTEGRCACGRPYRRIAGVQGRAQEALRFTGLDGGQVVIQPVLFHRALDMVPARGWQIVQDREGLTVLVAGLSEGFDPELLLATLRNELRHANVAPPAIRVDRVQAIPRTALGKAPLIRSTLNQAGQSQ